MIHLLEVSPELTPVALKKLARRYAMTGGYELALYEGINRKGLDALLDTFVPEVLAIEGRMAERISSNAYRIVELVASHPLADGELEKRVFELRNSLTSPPV